MTALLAAPIPALYALPPRPQVPAPRLVVVAELVGGDAPGAGQALLDRPRYEWTARGLAVMLALVVLVVGVMATTLVSAFLAVSDEPLPAPGIPVAVVGVAAR